MEYKITNVQQRDEFTTQYGQMQSYAISLEGQTGWIALNQKLETPPPRVGDTINGEIQNATTRNGNEYRKFKKINPKFAGGGGGEPQKLTYIVEMLEELTGRKQAHEEPVVGQTAPPDESYHNLLPNQPSEDDPFAGLGI